MRKLADAVVNWLLSRARWYDEQDLEAREKRSADAITDSRAARDDAEKAVGRGLGSYGRVKVRR